MALSVNPNQTYRLRDLRDNTVGRGRSEPRAPTKRQREFSLRDDKAGEVVGRFPTLSDPGPERPRIRRNMLREAASRQQPRSAVAALMAREGISTSTRLGSTRAASPAAAKATPDAPPAWMKLANHKPEVEPRDERLAAMREEMRFARRFSEQIGGTSMLDRALKANEVRILREAGKVERNVAQQAQGVAQNGAKKSGVDDNMAFMKKEMALNQQLNLQYLAIQDKLLKGLSSFLSNLMKVRDEVTKGAISSI